MVPYGSDKSVTLTGAHNNRTTMVRVHQVCGAGGMFYRRSSSPVRQKAIACVLNRPDEMRRYTEDGRLEIENNT
jgi:hypothetical protein